MQEIPYDGIDQDQDGFDLVDQDHDGFASTLAFGFDCNDRDPHVHPNTWDWIRDGVDRNCDGSDGFLEIPIEEWKTIDLSNHSWIFLSEIGIVFCVLVGFFYKKSNTTLNKVTKESK